MPQSWHWTGHSGGYWQQVELLNWCKPNNDNDDDGDDDDDDDDDVSNAQRCSVSPWGNQPNLD